MSVKFIADCMLGKLAKWLRMLGYDTMYNSGAADDELTRIAVREDRILLTRDRALCDRRMVRKRCVFVDWGSTRAQVKQVFEAMDLHLVPESLFTRCAVCNSEIVPLDKAEVQDKVPPFVYKTQSEYGYCSHCDKIYWRGTHVQHVLEALDFKGDEDAGSDKE